MKCTVFVLGLLLSASTFSQTLEDAAAAVAAKAAANPESPNPVVVVEDVSPDNQGNEDIPQTTNPRPASEELADASARRTTPRPSTETPEMISRSDLVMCPIIDRSAQVRRDTASTVDDVRRSLQQAQQALGRGRSQACQTVGSSIQNLINGFSAPPGGRSECENNPQTCASRFADVLPIIDSCTESRSSLADMATSVALNLTAGSPAGLIALGVAGFRSIMNLFRDRSEAREARENERIRIRETQNVIEAAASCGMMSLYFSSVCAPAASNQITQFFRVRERNGGAQAPRCENNASIGLDLKSQISSAVQVGNCLQARRGAEEQCFQPPTLPNASSNATPTATPEQRIACIASEMTRMGTNIERFKTTEIPEMLRLARRHHTREIIRLRDRLQNVPSVDERTSTERARLITQCFYGKMARTISATDPYAEATREELVAQDAEDNRRIYRGDRTAERVSIADNNSAIDSICNTLDRCIRADRNASRTISLAAFGPSVGDVSRRMCNGIGRFNQLGSNYLGNDLNYMEAAVGDGGTYGQNCQEPAAGTPEGENGTTVQGV